MTTLGYLLTSEEFHPNELVRQAVRAEAAGFERLWISDHFHPWSEQQGHSPFVWSVIGALSQACSLPVTTAVTCPIMRIHPAVIAQAAATAAAQLDGRFVLGVGTAYSLWANEQLPGQLGQILPTPRDFEQASSLVPESAVEQAVPCGPDAKLFVDRIREFADAGFDEVYVQQIGPDQDGFFDFWESEIAPELAA